MLPANPCSTSCCRRSITAGDDIRQLSGRPPAITNEQALDDLHDIADGFVAQSRHCSFAWTTSVVRDSGEMLRGSGIRAGRDCVAAGFRDVPRYFCLGADLKNTFCLVRGEQAVVSQHLGDLSDDGIGRSGAGIAFDPVNLILPRRIVCVRIRICFQSVVGQWFYVCRQRRCYTIMPMRRLADRAWLAAGRKVVNPDGRRYRHG